MTVSVIFQIPRMSFLSVYRPIDQQELLFIICRLAALNIVTVIWYFNFRDFFGFSDFSINFCFLFIILSTYWDRIIHCKKRAIKWFFKRRFFSKKFEFGNINILSQKISRFENNNMLKIFGRAKKVRACH